MHAIQIWISKKYRLVQTNSIPTLIFDVKKVNN